MGGACPFLRERLFAPPDAVDASGRKVFARRKREREERGGKGEGEREGGR